MATALRHRALLSLTDIAALARVQRPVPTVWRSRSAGSLHPFPEPVHRADGQDYFDLDQVVEWLKTTGRGNNAEVREESRLFVALDVVPEADRRAVLDGLTACLALKAVVGLELGGLTPAELLDLADDLDPHDVCLYRELEVLGEEAQWWAEHADAISNAAFTPARAFSIVLSHHRRLGLREHSATALAPSVGELVARIAVELVPPDRRGSTPFVDPTGAADLLDPLRAHLAEADSPTALVPPGRSPEARLARRQLLAAGWDVRDAATDDGAVSLPAGSVVLAHVPTVTSPRMTDAQVVDVVDRIALAMHDEDRAIVVGPASALTNRTHDAAVAQARTEVLRTGRVRAVIRLPAGLWPARSREQLALWVLGAAHAGVPSDERWITVADLAPHPLNDAAVEDLVTDVVAAMGDRHLVHGHAFRFARLLPASTVQAAAGDLVTVTAPVPRPRLSPAEMAVQVRTLAARVAEPAPPVAVELVHGDHAGVRVMTLGELVAAKVVRVVPGNRIEVLDLVRDGDIPAIGVDELLGARRPRERALDRLAFSAGYPSGRYTEPGDVVFCSTPGIGAVVDTTGLSVVVSPARVLRLAPDSNRGISPELLAHAVRAAPLRAPWRTWPVRLVPPSQAAPIDAALNQIRRANMDAQRRLDDLGRLADVLVDGVTSGGLTLNRTSHRDDVQAEQEG